MATHSSILENPRDGGAWWAAVYGVTQSRTRLKRLSSSSSSSSMYSMCQSLSCVWLFATSWTIAHQVSLAMEFSRQEYWSELPLPSPRNLPYPGIEPRSPTLPEIFLLYCRFITVYVGITKHIKRAIFKVWGKGKIKHSFNFLHGPPRHYCYQIVEVWLHVLNI